MATTRIERSLTGVWVVSYDRPGHTGKWANEVLCCLLCTERFVGAIPLRDDCTYICDAQYFECPMCGCDCAWPVETISDTIPPP